MSGHHKERLLGHQRRVVLAKEPFGHSVPVFSPEYLLTVDVIIHSPNRVSDLFILRMDNIRKERRF